VELAKSVLSTVIIHGVHAVSTVVLNRSYSGLGLPHTNLANPRGGERGGCALVVGRIAQQGAHCAGTTRNKNARTTHAPHTVPLILQERGDKGQAMARLLQVYKQEHVVPTMQRFMQFQVWQCCMLLPVQT